MSGFRLRDLGFGYRVGLTGVLACLAVGQLAGLAHMRGHFDKRDDRPGFTVDDIKSAYHGLNAPSPLLAALDRGHPPALKDDERKVLRAWLTSGKIEQDYDNPDLGVASPKEIVAASCLQCHSTRAPSDKAHPLKLDSAADIKKVAFSRQVLPTPADKVTVSVHAHAPSMALMALAVMMMAAFARWSRGLTGGLAALCGLGLTAEFAGMWFARSNDAMVNLLLIGGGAFHAAFALLTLLAFADLWLPGGRSKGCRGGKCGCRDRSAPPEAAP
ncbi:MAG TPA: hypothetical protein VEB22_13860 [Phycisphaerales bacterium]|nr:hypothetical protein [Phycisphaerales bacterium]